LIAIKKRQGDYAEGELQSAMDTPKLIGDAVKNGKNKANGKLTIAFACGVDHAEHIAQEFFNAGIPPLHCMVACQLLSGRPLLALCEEVSSKPGNRLLKAAKRLDKEGF
jgi:hypothetical protein